MFALMYNLVQFTCRWLILTGPVTHMHARTHRYSYTYIYEHIQMYLHVDYTYRRMYKSLLALKYITANSLCERIALGTAFDKKICK